MRIEELFDLQGFDHPALFADAPQPWEPLHRLVPYLAERTALPRQEGEVHPTAVVEGNVVICPGAVIGAGAIIRGPAIIGPGAFVGDALVRGSILGPGAVVGHGCEVARSILLTGARVAHLAAAADSILGRNVNVAGGCMIANLKLDESEVQVVWEGRRWATGLCKMGGLLGDEVKLGAHCTLMPGTILGPRCLVYPGAILRGTYGVEEPVIVKITQKQIVVRRASPGHGKEEK
jgi:NDP-sugar pyrophosphorylase family protein